MARWRTRHVSGGTPRRKQRIFRKLVASSGFRGVCKITVGLSSVGQSRRPGRQPRPQSSAECRSPPSGGGADSILDPGPGWRGADLEMLDQLSRLGPFPKRGPQPHKYPRTWAAQSPGSANSGSPGDLSRPPVNSKRKIMHHPAPRQTHGRSRHRYPRFPGQARS
jgi:hypothetical protein